MKLYGLLSFLVVFLKLRFKCFRVKSAKKFKRSFISTLPCVIKKQTLVVTLYLKGRNEKVFDDVDMKQLNRCLILANDPKVLDYLVSINEKCDWYRFDFNNLLLKHNCTLNTRVDNDILTSICEDIIGKTPMYLRYSKSQMIQDISGLLLKVPMSRNHQCPLKLN